MNDYPSAPPTKSLLESKTFWINLLGGIASVTGMTTGLIPATAMPYVAAASAVANIILRLLTDTPATMTGNPKS